MVHSAVTDYDAFVRVTSKAHLTLDRVWWFERSQPVNQIKTSSLLRMNILAQNSGCFSNHTLFFSSLRWSLNQTTVLLREHSTLIHAVHSQLGPASSSQLCAINPCAQVQLLCLFIYEKVMSRALICFCPSSCLVISFHLMYKILSRYTGRNYHTFSSNRGRQQKSWYKNKL